MSYLIVGLISAAYFHFLYESVLAPSFRLKLRFELFALRDELRRLKIERADCLDDTHFDFLQESLNGLIRILDRFSVATLIAVENGIRRNPCLEEQLEVRARILDDCEIPNVLSIRDRSLRIAARAVAVNNGAWAIYLGPATLPFLGLSKLKKLIKASLSLPGAQLEEASTSSLA
ncbi:MAG: hypothetical protein ABI885_18725 [Gammaproteobacteria bacterium]